MASAEAPSTDTTRTKWLMSRKMSLVGPSATASSEERALTTTVSAVVPRRLVSSGGMASRPMSTALSPTARSATVLTTAPRPTASHPRLPSVATFISVLSRRADSLPAATTRQ